MNSALKPDVQSQLAQLRDIRLPHEVGLWPLSPGWWMLIILSVVLLAALVSWRVLRRYGARYLALRELETMPQDDSREFATQLSMLLKRVARRKHQHVAQLSGVRWAEFLSNTGLARQHAQYLADATYTTEPVAANAALRRDASNWIRRQT